ncbi:hypothetical protein INT43_004725 [Umbelopsis isabellina]|uniref:Uncharacterized protein n=1 Tax=Mortierella isabellina TaxID=91625 RepID=A0A8H7PG58_MORIS|nr:hypothetical protein INT43_004725 [Umbelopsis isabellina]
MSQDDDFRSAMINQRPGHAAIRRKQKAEAEKAAAAGLPPPASATAESFDATAKMIVFSLIAAVLSFAFYLPYNSNQKLMGYGREAVEDIGLEHCKKSTGPAYCDDVHVHSQTGLAFLSCDTAKAIWNPPFGIQNDTLVSATPRSGEIWVQDLRTDASVPKRLEVVGLDGAFHPLGLSSFPEGDSPQPIRLMIVNQANSSSSTVELFEVQDTKLVHLRTIADPKFQNLYRITADPNQFNGNPELSVPSFWVAQHHRYDLFTQPYGRYFEDLLRQSSATASYYNSVADEVDEIIWYLSAPTSIMVDKTDKTKRLVHVAHSGGIDSLRSTLVSAHNQVDIIIDKRTGREVKAFWPSMIYEENLKAEEYPYGFDIGTFANEEEPAGSSSTVIASLPRFHELADIAKESLQLQKVSDKRTATRVYRTLPERRWHSTLQPVNKELITHAMEDFEEKTYLAKVQKLIFSNEDGSIFSGATGLGVSDKHNKMILVGAYEQGSLTCTL